MGVKNFYTIMYRIEFSELILVLGLGLGPPPQKAKVILSIIIRR